MNPFIGQLRANLQTVIQGKDEVIDLLLIALCSGGNVLMEDVPGVGKTTLAKALARSIDGGFQRVQFTPDLLPSDIIGSSMYNPKDAAFHFRRGPVFTNVLLADEINRASPRTQSALLEAMNEGQVTIDAQTYVLDRPFLVIATENPIEYQGTYPLPEAQLDRFAMQLVIGYPDEENEIAVLYSRKEVDPLTAVQPVINCADICAVQDEVRRVDVEHSIAEYVVRLVRATRQDPRIRLGASPRALLTLSRCAQSRAFLAGRSFVLPEDVKALAVPVLSHRLALENKARYSGVRKESLIHELLGALPVPS
jgi:MoxR-like ATPase